MEKCSGAEIRMCILAHRSLDRLQLPVHCQLYRAGHSSGSKSKEACVGCLRRPILGYCPLPPPLSVSVSASVRVVRVGFRGNFRRYGRVSCTYTWPLEEMREHYTSQATIAISRLECTCFSSYFSFGRCLAAAFVLGGILHAVLSLGPPRPLPPLPSLGT